MHTTITETGADAGVCPVTGMPVISRPEWTDRQFGGDYRLTTRVIGDRILLNRPSGHAQLKDIVESLRLTDAVVGDCIDQRSGYVHISDYSGMRGISLDARRYYVRYIEERRNILGVIYFGASPLFQLMIKLAKRLSLVKPNVRIVDDYRAALSAAMMLIGAASASASVPSADGGDTARITEHVENGRRILRCERWHLDLDDYRLRVEVIDGRIYHAISIGAMQAHHVAPVDRLRDSVRRMLGLEKGFPVIMTSTAANQGNGRDVRRQYIDTLKRWHARFPLKLYVFYDANWFVRTAAALAIPFVPFKVRVARDQKDALALADRFLGLSTGGEPAAAENTIEDPTHVVHQLLQFIGDIDWEKNGTRIPAPIGPTHPFRPVFDAIALVKGELDTVFDERRQAERALRESQERFDEVLRHSRDILFKRDIHTGSYSYISHAVKELLGYSPEQVCRMGFEGVKALVHPDDLSDFLKFKASIPADADGASDFPASEYRIRDHQGRYRWFSDKRTIIHDANGKAAFVIGNNRDITAQKLAEEERRVSYKRFTTVLDSISAHIYVADMETYEILFMNRAMRDAFGDARPGDRCFTFFRGAGEACPHCITDKLLDEQGQPSGIHTWEGLHPIKGRWYLNHDQAIRWVDDRMVRLQIAMDITRIKSLEQERQEIAERLRHTRKLEAVSTMAGGVAHNFNNLLMVVLGNLELLRMEVGENRGLLHKIEAAEKSATKAADLSTLMLTYVGQTKISPQNVDLNASLAKMVDVLKTTAAEKATLIREPTAVAAMIDADVSKVYQVITNLVTNAVEASGDRPLEIRLGVGVQYCDRVQLSRLAPGDRLPEGRYVWLRVSDNGQGMNQETLEKVFDPFFTTKFAGRGLGMAAVMGIMRAHRGGVRIDSRVDAGTAVTVYFPERERIAAAVETPPAHARLPTQERRGTALLVDDEPLVLELGAQMLDLMGFDVLTAVDGMDALAVFERHRDRIRLVLLDINMPRMGGREALDRLRSLGASFPVLVTSGFTEAQARERLGDSQVDGYINKPFRIDQLKDKIDAIFNRSTDNRSSG